MMLLMSGSVSYKARQKESINDLEANEAGHSLVFDGRRVSGLQKMPNTLMI